MREYGAVWDTGATTTAVSMRVVNECGLVLSSREFQTTANGARIAGKYPVNVYLPNRICIEGIQVVDADISGNENILLGMDIIAGGDFAVSQDKGNTVFSFCFPSSRSIDFVKEIDQEIQERNINVRKRRNRYSSNR